MTKDDVLWKAQEVADFWGYKLSYFYQMWPKTGLKPAKVLKNGSLRFWRSEAREIPIRPK